ncbi:hypothetical protein [Namhaeicola litoreus]|uniref:DUF4382 domain-containing protein n=1 Tax=Namhaeicola litoreus TaxID=1052145 RepID=A0ABW3Y7G3_9FLAO
MKKLNILILLAISLIAFSSCSDDDETLNYVTFADKTTTFGVDLDGTNTNTFKVYTTKIMGSTRTFDIQVSPSSTADPASYTVPSSVSVPGGSNEGSFDVTISDINIGENGKTLILELVPQDGVFLGQRLVLNVKQVCPNNEVILAIVFDEYPEESSWALFDANDVEIDAGSDYAGAESFTKAFCLENGTYTFVMYDAYGDGINAPGYYRLTNNGNVIVEGGGFETIESTTFTVSK